MAKATATATMKPFQQTAMEIPENQQKETPSEKILEISATDKLKGKKFRIIGNDSLLIEIDNDLNVMINKELTGTVKELRGSLIVRKIISGIPFTAKIPMAMLYV